jgi:hypothetical protein
MRHVEGERRASSVFNYVQSVVFRAEDYFRHSSVIRTGSMTGSPRQIRGRRVDYRPSGCTTTSSRLGLPMVMTGYAWTLANNSLP